MNDTAHVPSLRSDVDMTRVSLSVDDMFVVSRIDGRASVKELSMLLGKKPEETERILTRLAKLGVVQYGGVQASEPAGPRSVFDIPSGFIFPVALMQEAGELDVATRKRVIWAFENLERWTHYELLQIDRKADKDAVKKAYRERTKEWHPDRFRAKNLGSFKRMIEAVFKRLNEAQKVLADDRARLEYDKTIIFELSPEEMKEVMWKAGAEDREKRREDSMKARRLAKNPVLLKKQQAREFYEAALAAESEGKLIEARRQAQMAVTYDPKNADYPVLVQRLAEAAVDTRLAPLLKRGKYHESLTQWDEAIEYLQEAVRIAPDNGTAHLRLAYNMLMGHQPIDEVIRHAQKAVGALPEDAEAHFILGRCFEAKDMAKNAKKHYEDAVRLRPNYQEAKKRLNKLKWGF